MELSSRVKGLTESVTLKLNTKAIELSESGVQIYNLTAGQLPFRPPQGFVDAIRDELDFLKSYQYSPVAGFIDLRSKIVRHIEESRGINFSANELEGVEFDCVVSNGAKHSISNILGAIVDPGDEVIIIAPYWVSYPAMINFCRGVPIIIQTSIFDVFSPPLQEIRKAISAKTKAIIINSPNNPAGVHYSSEWMSDFADLLLEYPDVAVISDEIYYEVFYYDPKPTYFYQKKPELLKRTIIVDGISKAYASTGLRLGYCVGPKNICKGIEYLQGQLTSCPSSLIQRALINYNFSNSTHFLTPVKDHLRDNATIIREKFKDNDLMKCWYQPVSALYFMIDFTQTPVFQKYQQGKNDKTDYAVKICEDMLNVSGVVIVPGSDFGMQNSARISLVPHKEVFSEAITKVVHFLNS